MKTSTNGRALTERHDHKPERGSRERTSSHILEVATELFSNFGYSGTSMADIAKQVGIKTPSLYNHFQSKDELYGAVISALYEPYFTILEGAAEGDLVATIMEHLRRHPALPRMMLYESLAGGERIRRILSERAGLLLRQAAATVSRLGIQGLDPMKVVLFFNTMMFGYFAMIPWYEQMIGEDPLSLESVGLQAELITSVASAIAFLTGRADEPEIRAEAPESRTEIGSNATLSKRLHIEVIDASGNRGSADLEMMSSQ